MESLKVIKKLGYGVFGTTYLIKIGNKKYAAKIGKILDTEIKEDLSLNIWREIEFSKFASKYPNQFMELKSWEVIKDCNHVQKIPVDWKGGPADRKMIINRNKSPHCLKLIYSPVLDDTLESFYEKINKHATVLSTKQFWSMMCQILYALNLLKKNGYMHRDIHPGNIMYKKTSKKTIKLGSIIIKTYGLQWYIIDYGMMVHEKYPKSSDSFELERQMKSLNNITQDIAFFIHSSLEMPIWKIVKKYKLNVSPFKILVENIKNKLKEPEYAKINKYIQKNIPKIYLSGTSQNKKIREERTENICMAILFQINCPVEYHECMGIDVKKYKKFISIYLSDTIIYYTYIIKHINNINKVIKYLKP